VGLIIHGQLLTEENNADNPLKAAVNPEVIAAFLFMVPVWDI
jgi:hypothetical protein